MSDQYAQVNGDRITSGTISVPYYGAWTADLVLASTTALPANGDACTVSVGALALKGTAYRSGAFAGARSVRIVGGGAGWRKTLPARAYGQRSGVKLSMVLNDAAADLGETVSLSADSSLGPAYVRSEGPGTNLLRELCAPLWWVGADGVTRVAPARPSNSIGSQFDVLAWKGDTGWFQVATEQHQDWVPGNTFASITGPTAPQTISLVTYDVSNDGKLRVEVLTTGAANV